jgi:hypothetical protein
VALRDFILTEKLTQEHAERYLTFVDRYHGDVFGDLHKRLTAAWEAELVQVNTECEAIADAIQDRDLRSPGIDSTIQLSATPQKLTSPRHRDPKMVSPSIKIPYVYHRETLDNILKRLMKVAKKTFDELAVQWGEIFNYEKRGQVTPGFRVELGDLHEGLKFKIISTISGEEAYRTIYSVQIDHGRAGSKTRDFDRIYLSSHV